MTRTPIRRLSAGLALALVGTLALAACGSSDGGGEGDGDVGVSLIVKTTTNPFFVAMQDGAKKAAEDEGVDLTLAAGKDDGDEATQIQAIENAISQGQKGILITPNGPGVVDAIEKARDARAVRHRPRHPAGSAGRRGHHLRHRQLRRRQGDRILDGQEARRREGHHRSAGPVRRQGRLGRLQPRPGLPRPAWASTRRTPRRTATRPRPAATAVATTRSPATRPRKAPRTAEPPRWRPACRRTTTSTSSTPSTSPPPTARTRR